jgi:hypothetical protein
MPTFSQVTAAQVPCAMPTKDNQPCGKPGGLGLPAGICEQHAIQVYRAIVALGAASQPDAPRRRTGSRRAS